MLHRLRFSLFAALLIAACAPVHSGPNAYVFDLGGPQTITDWTLAPQTSPDRIQAGGSALAELMDDNNPYAARIAAAGFVRIARRLEKGWNENAAAPPAGTPPFDSHAILIAAAAQSAAHQQREKQTQLDRTDVLDALLQIVPPHAAPDLVKEWTRQVEWVRENQP